VAGGRRQVEAKVEKSGDTCILPVSLTFANVLKNIYIYGPKLALLPTSLMHHIASYSPLPFIANCKCLKIYGQTGRVRAWIQPFVNYETLGKSLNFFDTQFPYLEDGIMVCMYHKTVVRLK
jgi:hypothetical protein